MVLIYPIPPRNQYLPPEPLDLSIISEDEDIALVNKQPGMCVHPTLAYPSGTLANGLVYHWLENNPAPTFHAVNRIDRNTSGLVLVAKNSYSAQKLFLQRKRKQLARSYVALVHGKIVQRNGYIDLPLEKCEGKTTKRQISSTGQQALTRFEVLQYITYRTLIRFMPAN